MSSRNGAEPHEREFRVHLPLRYTGEPRTISFSHKSNEWSKLAFPYLKGDEVRMPERLVAPESCVEDESRHVIGSDGKLLCDASPIRSGCVALVLESPHVREFDDDLNALRPLNNGSSIRLLKQTLPHLLGQVQALSGIEVAGRQLALVNAVQHQCSLQHFMRPDVRGLQRCVRDIVWTTMFDAGGGEDLLARLRRYEPALVILAPTRMVRQALVDEIGKAPRPWPWLLASGHPTSWRPVSRRPFPLDLQPGDKKVVMPGDGPTFTQTVWADAGARPYRCTPIKNVVRE